MSFFTKRRCIEQLYQKNENLHTCVVGRTIDVWLFTALLLVCALFHTNIFDEKIENMIKDYYVL